MASLIFDVKFGEINGTMKGLTWDQHVNIVFISLKLTPDGLIEFLRAAEDFLKQENQPSLRALDDGRKNDGVRHRNTKEREMVRSRWAIIMEMVLKYMASIKSIHYAGLMTALLKMHLLGVELPDELPNDYRDWLFLIRAAMMEQCLTQQEWAKSGATITGGTKEAYEARLKGASADVCDDGGSRGSKKRKPEASGGGGGGGGGSKPDTKSKKREAQAGKDKPLCYGCGISHFMPCYRGNVPHPCYNTNSKIKWVDSSFGREGAKLVPPMLHLSDTFDTKGNTLKKETRQSLITARCLAMNITPVPAAYADKDITPWGPKPEEDEPKAEIAPRTPKPKGELRALCCGQRCIPTALLCYQTTPTPNELCTCVSIFDESSSKFSNQTTVFLSSPTQREDTSLLLPKRKRASTVDKAEHTIARLDTGASCHDFISQQLADTLIAAGAKMTPVIGQW